MRIKSIIVSLFLVATFIQMRGTVSVTARLDSVNLLMGNMTQLHLDVTENVGVNGRFEIFKDADLQRGYVGICGDSIELRTSYNVDTVPLGSGRIQVNYAIPVQAFDSGTFLIPEFIYIAGGDTARSNTLVLNVEPIHNLTADDPIAGLAQVAEPEGKQFYDAVPDWILDFWWVLLIIVLAVIAFLWAMKRYKKGDMPLVRKAVQLTPYQMAMSRLSDLKAKKLWEQGMEKEYFTQLTEILRIYLQDRFGINAMEMTTRQIMDCLYESDVKEKRDYIRQILKVADFVKFAKVRPLPADNVEAFENAVRFVEETRPVENESEQDTNVDKEGGDK